MQRPPVLGILAPGYSGTAQREATGNPGQTFMAQLILTRHDNKEVETTVGWDEKTQSYYMRVYDLNGDTIINIGAKRPSDIRSLPALRLKAGQYERHITPQVAAKLKWAKATRSGHQIHDLTATPSGDTAA